MIAEQKYPDMLLNACKDIGLGVNTRKTKYMELARHRGMMENEHSKYCEKLKTSKYVS